MKYSMRKIERKLSQEQSLKILHESEYGILSTVDGCQQPYGIPINFAFIMITFIFIAHLKGIN